MSHLKRLSMPEEFNVLMLDRAQSEQGQLPEYHSSTSQAYFRHFSEWNAMKCEAQVLEQSLPHVLQVRALLFRGRHTEAEQIMAEALRLNGDISALSEVLLEKVKLAALEGDWRLCVELAEALHSSQIAPVSRMTLFQVEGLARFELGEFNAAQNLLERAESLSTCFPHGTSGLYSKILQIKIAARRQGAEVALKMLFVLWREWVEAKVIDINLVQALLRAEIDLKRLAGLPHLRQAHASLLIAEAMGEKLYVGLGVLDCCFAASGDDRALFEARLSELSREFKRLRSLLSELDRDDGLSSSAEAIRVYQDHCRKNPALAATKAPIEPADTLFFPSVQISLSLKSRKAFDWKTYPKLMQAVSAYIDHGELSKEQLFAKVWGNQKYAPRLHDSSIFSLQQRLKKLEVALTSKHSRLKLVGTYFVY
jgi:hypothetical protein